MAGCVDDKPWKTNGREKDKYLWPPLKQRKLIWKRRSTVSTTKGSLTVA